MVYGSAFFPDPDSQFDADPDPDRHQNNGDPHADKRTASLQCYNFPIIGKSVRFKYF